jgi:exodeoxyribonuclease V alpha subunit
VPSGLPPIKVDAAVTWAQEKAGFEFHGLQSAAIKNALTHKFTILTGGPGTGKTTILRALVDILKAKKVRVTLAAPTGRAAQRLAETTGGFASTIHRLLKFENGAFTVNESHPLATDFLIVDEASMLDTRLAAALLQAVPARAHLLLVGDIDQLPSVGAGNVLKDLIAVSSDLESAAPSSNRLPVTRLSFVYRQGKESAIVTTACDQRRPRAAAARLERSGKGAGVERSELHRGERRRGLPREDRRAHHAFHSGAFQVVQPDHRRASARADAQRDRRRR